MSLIEKIDALLPQTQCELCEYPGCLPYAKAIATENAPIDRCVPGGTKTLKALANLLNQNPDPLIDNVLERARAPLTPVIDEDACIGCTKCIQACPVDAIFGAAKQMHTVIESECNGCGLCVPPCPVDCIDMVPAAESSDDRLEKTDQYRSRFVARNTRLERLRNEAKQKHQASKTDSRAARKQAILDAIARKKNG